MGLEWDLEQVNTALNAQVVTPNDGAELARPVRAIYIGVSGDLRVLMFRGLAPITFKNMAAGQVYRIAVKKIFATGTTATNIISLR